MRRCDIRIEDAAISKRNTSGPKAAPLADRRTPGLTRRQALAGAAAAAGAALGATAGRASGASAALAQPDVLAQPVAGPPLVARDGKYATVPLTRESLRVTAVQSRIRAVDARNPAKQIRENLAHMIELIDDANGFPGPQDLVCFHAQTENEEFVTATIPIGEFRKTHILPEIPMAMVMPVYSQYLPRYNPGLQDHYIPTDFADASRYYASKRNW